MMVGLVGLCVYRSDDYYVCGLVETDLKATMYIYILY